MTASSAIQKIFGLAAVLSLSLPVTAAAKHAKAAPAKADPAEAAHPATCEVELFAEIKSTRTLPPSHQWVAYVTEGDCLAKEPRVLGRQVIASGPKFMTEVIAPWGSNLTLCVVAEDASGTPSRIYGKAKKKFHAEGTGEVVFHNIVVDVKSGPAHAFSATGPRTAARK